MRTLVVKPADGRRVLNHQRGFIPLAADGETVTEDMQVRRWIKAGDVIEVTTPSVEPKKKASSPTNSNPAT